MPEAIYTQLCETLARRGGRYPGMDIPEFYELAEALFSPEEAEIYVAIPSGHHPADTIATRLGRDPGAVMPLLEQMADKGLCTAATLNGVTFYGAPRFVPGIFEFQFMKGTKTDRDRKIAKLIHAYKSALDAAKGPPEVTYPTTRVIPVNSAIENEHTVHTYHQVATYIENAEPISVSTCFCRHEAKLIDASDDCGKPDEVCMQFGLGAQFVIDRKLGRRVSKQEALEILDAAEEAGLVHASINRQDIDFICNCCACHCMIIQTALAQSRPGLALNSGFQPRWNTDRCIACETCIDRCPADALAMKTEEVVPEVNPDRCIGCGVCATGCTENAVTLVERDGIAPPPPDQNALRKAIKESRM